MVSRPRHLAGARHALCDAVMGSSLVVSIAQIDGQRELSPVMITRCLDIVVGEFRSSQRVENLYLEFDDLVMVRSAQCLRACRDRPVRLAPSNLQRCALVEPVRSASSVPRARHCSASSRRLQRSYAWAALINDCASMLMSPPERAMVAARS